MLRFGRSGKFRVLLCACSLETSVKAHTLTHASFAVCFSFEGLGSIAPLDENGESCIAELEFLKDLLRVRRTLDGMPAAFPLAGFHLISPTIPVPSMCAVHSFYRDLLRETMSFAVPQRCWQE